jgi:hypothetical protein
MSELEVVLARFGAAIAERERQRHAAEEKPEHVGQEPVRMATVEPVAHGVRPSASVRPFFENIGHEVFARK